MRLARYILFTSFGALIFVWILIGTNKTEVTNEYVVQKIESTGGSKIDDDTYADELRTIAQMTQMEKKVTDNKISALESTINSLKSQMVTQKSDLQKSANEKISHLEKLLSETGKKLIFLTENEVRRYAEIQSKFNAMKDKSKISLQEAEAMIEALESPEPTMLISLDAGDKEASEEIKVSDSKLASHSSNSSLVNLNPRKKPFEEQKQTQMESKASPVNLVSLSQSFSKGIEGAFNVLKNDSKNNHDEIDNDLERANDIQNKLLYDPSYHLSLSTPSLNDDEIISITPYKPASLNSDQLSSSFSSSNRTKEDITNKSTSFSTLMQGKTTNIFDVSNKNPFDITYKEQSNQGSNNNTEQLKPVPVYTIPNTATLTLNSLMTPLIGRIPNTRNNVNDPFRFKFITGAENLATNGLHIPGIENIIWTGYAVGVRDQSCVRAYVDTVTYTFSDGRINTISKGKNSGSGQTTGDNYLGYLTDQWGKPCIRGHYISNATDYLKDQTLAAFISGISDAVANANIEMVNNRDGDFKGFVTGNTGQYIAGKGLSGSAKALSDYISERAVGAFDIIYVESGLNVQMFVETEIPIDYDPNGRKLAYDYSSKNDGMLLEFD